jgi:peptidoglycan/LPS O-acetylase OafA/YrhL
MLQQNRFANIDMLRSIAIIMVVIYHSVNMSNLQPQWVWDLAETGSLGVDLFFVLSGFLVGSLYWKEYIKFSNVDILLFIKRRVFRTIPMYFLVMPMAYLPVYLIKSTPFDWKYLFFLQNYNISIPFYAISWSLCVEEHFYLIFPFLAHLFMPISKKIGVGLLLLLLLLPTFLRIITYDLAAEANGFGYYTTATYYHYESLLLGVLLAYGVIHQSAQLVKLLNYRWYIYGITFLSVIGMAFMPNYFRYCFSFSLVAVTFSASLLVAYYDTPYSMAIKKTNYLIAISSYSTYLIHSLVIHVFVKFLFPKLHITNAYIMAPMMCIACLIAGYVLYELLEKRLMKWRNMFAPAR